MVISNFSAGFGGNGLAQIADSSSYEKAMYGLPVVGELAGATAGPYKKTSKSGAAEAARKANKEAKSVGPLLSSSIR